MNIDPPGLLLLNLGTPASPRVRDVRRYLREFLSDPRVLDIPAWQRRLVLEAFILPFRPKTSAAAYEKVWMPEGSPLLVYSQRMVAKVAERLGNGVCVELAMRYGEPSIPDALRRLRERGARRIVVFPLYPQYSSAATGSSLERIFEVAGQLWNVPNLSVVPAFYDHPAFLAARLAVARPVLEESQPEKVFFSFHGLPERQIRKSDPSGTHCLEAQDCCAKIGINNTDCYRAHCMISARALADALEIPEEKRVVCFQSRLGRTPWLRPFTDVVLQQEAASGVRNATILSPAFVADCLETLEELKIRAADIWRAAGGDRLTVVPSLNDHDLWVDAVIQIASETAPWLTRAPEAR